MLLEADLKATGPNCARLHAYFMKHNKDKLLFPVNRDENKNGNSRIPGIASEIFLDFMPKRK
jgi:hypothetical protein